MKNLILMRHAKSAWDDPQQKDVDRPLSTRGRKVAPRMGKWLAAEGYRPDVVLCSAARRARETLERLRPHLPENAAVEFADGLYMAAPRDMLTEIGKVPATAETVMLIGHNPGMGSLAGLLAGRGDEKALGAMHGKFPTAAIAVLGFNVGKWNELAPGDGILRAFMRPRDLDQA
ncbi:SixA phosphatase family protein [Dongia sedimenti]|uniref:Histidine phosphatase family protein n=1 Tax=Dongia sedimenti TaxID=3064282 RepID=A0ABU0YHP9_9PROT|nr:histidine phosphatase family protein [Rhodospirillaceae bacterium R-7]